MSAAKDLRREGRKRARTLRLEDGGVYFQTMRPDGAIEIRKLGARDVAFITGSELRALARKQGELDLFVPNV